MKYKFEEHLFTALEELDDLNFAIKDLSEKKEKIRNQIKEWRKINKVNDKIVMDNERGRWTITNSKTKRNSVRDYEVLKQHLGDQVDTFITESESEMLKITKNR